MAVSENFSVYKATDTVLTFTNPTPASIVGWTLTFTVRSAYGSTTALVTKTIGSGITVTDAANGIFTVTLLAADMTLDPRDYVFDVQRTNSGSVTVLAVGRLTVLPEVRVA